MNDPDAGTDGATAAADDEFALDCGSDLTDFPEVGGQRVGCHGRVGC